VELFRERKKTKEKKKKKESFRKCREPFA